MTLWNKRLIVVAGKGGVGRTTLSAALALAAAKHGKRALVVEMSGLSNVPPLFGRSGRSYTPRTVAEGVDVISLTAEECLEDFGRRKLRMPGFLRVVFRNRITRSFLDAVPGLQDLLQLGKVENLLHEPHPNDPRYDIVVLDAPATGHGLTLLAAARSMREMTRVGPFHDLARIIEEFLSSEETAVVVTTLPEELPIAEALELIEALVAQERPPSALVVNQVLQEPIPAGAPWQAVRAALLAPSQGSDPNMRVLVELTDRALDAFEQQEAALSTLPDRASQAAGTHVPVLRVARQSRRPPSVHAMVEELADQDPDAGTREAR